MKSFARDGDNDGGNTLATVRTARGVCRRPQSTMSRARSGTQDPAADTRIACGRYCPHVPRKRPPHPPAPRDPVEVATRARGPIGPGELVQLTDTRGVKVTITTVDVITQVYGTSFRVIAYNELDKIKVIVKTGKVKIRKTTVSEKNDLREITLLPNQAAFFDKKEDVFEKVFKISESDVLKSSLSEIDKLDFEFEDTHISEIFSTIQELYNINVEFSEEILKDCYVTTSLSDVPLPEKLKILSFSLGNNTSYEILGNKIIINSDGCNHQNILNNK